MEHPRAALELCTIHMTLGISVTAHISLLQEAMWPICRPLIRVPRRASSHPLAFVVITSHFPLG